jgi:hypothetical protein
MRSVGPQNDPVFESDFVINPRRHDSISMVSDEFDHSSIASVENSVGRNITSNYDSESCEDEDISSIDEFIDNIQDGRRWKKKKRNDSGRQQQQHEIDFLTDDVYEMTMGRRIALKLAKYSWYNPSLNKVDREDQQQKDQDAAVIVSVRTSSSRDKMEALTNTSLQEAWAYFEHTILPRYVLLDYTKQQGGGQGMCARTMEKYRQAHQPLEIAEPGEKFLKTRLYSPYFTPTRNMGDFGLGFGLYFSTLQALAFLFFAAGCLNIPNIMFFAGKDYSNYQPGVENLLKGSAICTNKILVPCVNCNSINFSDDTSRIVIMTHTTTNTKQAFAYHLACDVNFRSGMISLATLGLMCVGIFVLSRYLKHREERFDEENTTAQDFSIQILHPPKNENDPTTWKKYFETRFDTHVTCCTITVENDDLIDALVQRRILYAKIRKLITSKYKPKDTEDLLQIAHKIRSGRNMFSTLWFKIFKGLPEQIQELMKFDTKIQYLASKDYDVSSVFVTFETEESQREILSVLTNKKLSDKKYLFHGEFLEIMEPAEPSSIRWKDINEGWSDVVGNLIIPYIVTIVVIIGAAFAVREVRNYNVAYAAIFISIMNILFPLLAKFLTRKEIHRNEGSRHASLYIKITLFRWVNTAVVTTILTPFTSTLEVGDGSLLEGVYAIFISEIVTVNLLQLLDISGNISRHILAPRQKNQRDMNLCMRGTEIELAERYTNLTKIVFLTLWYCPIFPAAFFFGCLALFLNVYIDKFSLMRSWKPAPKLGAIISKLNRKYFLPTTVIVMAVISSYTWTQFSFDNLCQLDDTSQDFIGTWTVNNTIITVDENTSTYQYCDQNLFNRIPIVFPALPRFQDDGLIWMSDEQEKITFIYGWASIGAIGFLGLLMLKSAFFSFRRKYKTIGKAGTTPFTVSRCAAYIPQVNTSTFAYPLIAVNADEIGHTDLFEWSSPYHGYDYYDLSLDAKRIMSRDANQRYVAPGAFSKVKYWEVPFDQ